MFDDSRTKRVFPFEARTVVVLRVDSETFPPTKLVTLRCERNVLAVFFIHRDVFENASPCGRPRRGAWRRKLTHISLAQ